MELGYIKMELDRATGARQALVDKINELEAGKQQLFQEVLKVDGEVRLLTRLVAEAEKEK